MEIVTDLDASPWPGERAVITIGAYDGVHLGHRAVIDHVRRRADELGARSAVVTFDQHPASVVRPESAPPLLTTPDRKLAPIRSGHSSAGVRRGHHRSPPRKFAAVLVPGPKQERPLQ